MINLILPFLVSRIKTVILLIISLLFVSNPNDIAIEDTGAINKIFEKQYKASYYHDMFNNKKTSMGHIFNNNGLTCATSMPKKFIGKKITFLYKKTGKKVTLLCNDKMHPRMKGKVDFDLTKKAMKILSGKSKNYPGHIDLHIIKIENI